MRLKYILKYRAKISVASAILVLSVSFNLAAEKNKIFDKNAPGDYRQAEELYNRQDYKKSLNLFEKVKESNTPLKWKYLSKYYIAKGKVKIGKLKDSVNRLTELILSSDTFKYIASSEILGSLADIKNAEAIVALKDILKNSDITKVRNSAAKHLTRISKETDSRTQVTEYLLNILKSETEIEVAKTVSEAISELGHISAEKLIAIYKKGNDFTKRNILLLISKQDDEDLIMALQDDVGRSSGSVKNYILWALIKMDTYRFGDMFRGKLIFEDDNYYIKISGQKVLLITPFGNRESLEKELSGLKGRDVILYGKEVREGIIYSDCFEDK